MSEIPAAAPRLIGQTDVPVRWGDMDAFNHVNNAVYMRYLEEVRLEWLSGIPGANDMKAARPLLAACEIQYRYPIEWPATVHIELYCERVGNSSATLGYRLLTWPEGPQRTSRLHAECRTVMVWTDADNGRPVPIPDAIRASLAPSEEP
ncbi:acyl-CoA thioesterase [Frateuria aurantia]